MSRFAHYGMAATAEALNDSEWKPANEADLEATGVCLGSGIGNLDEMYNTSISYEKDGYKKVSPLFVPKLLINLGAGHISMKYGFRGPNHAVTTACTTGAHSIGDASRFIAFGDADVMVAGGAESCIHPLAIAGFARSRSLATNYNDDPQQASRPFDKDRQGFIMGEGAAVVILEELNHALARNAPIYAELTGYGLSADAHHMTAPLSSGAGALSAMKRALQHSSITPREIDYINAHATSTPLGDAAENAAIKTLMLPSSASSASETKQHPSEVNVSSTKGAIGHLLGAAGAIEALFSILAIKESVMPPTLNLTDYPEDHADKDVFNCNYVANMAQERDVRCAMTNSFGFGGTNSSLVFRRFEG